MAKRILSMTLLILLLTHCAGNTLRVGRETGDNAVTAQLGTGSGAESTDDFDVTIEQPDHPPAMGAPRIDVRYVISVRNLTSETVTVKRITVQSAGGAYNVEPRSRPFKLQLAPKSDGKVEFWATASNVDPVIGTNAPVTIRARIEFQQGEQTRQESFVRNVNGRASIGIR